MPRYIIKLTDDRSGIPYYMEWSTVVDAPVTGGGSLQEFKRYYRREYGNQGMRDLPDRLSRVEAKGTSDHMHADVGELIANNRAGKGETCLTKEQIIDRYCLGSGEADE
jgi:hypothetical protein